MVVDRTTKLKLTGSLNLSVPYLTCWRTLSILALTSLIPDHLKFRFIEKWEWLREKCRWWNEDMKGEQHRWNDKNKSGTNPRLLLIPVRCRDVGVESCRLQTLWWHRHEVLEETAVNNLDSASIQRIHRKETWHTWTLIVLMPLPNLWIV